MSGKITGSLAVTVLLLATTAGAAGPRLSVGPVKGDTKAVVPNQLAQLLCGTWDCVLWKEVSTRQEPDPAKARKLDVGGILTGVVVASGGGKKLTLSITTTSATPAKTWTFPLTAAGRLPESATRQLEQDLELLLRRPAPAAAPPPMVMAAPAAAAPPIRSPEPPPAAPRAAAPAMAAPPPASAPSPQAEERRWLAAGELGLFASQRRLSYGGVGPSTGTLLGFDASGMVGPSLSVEVFPLAHGTSAALGGLGLHLGVATSVGLETQAPSGEKLPTSFTRLELGARWRAPPLTGLKLVLVPEVSWVSQKLEVSPAISGLPNSDLSGVRLALAAEARVTGRITILAALGWVKWLTARELIDGSPPYFPGSSAAALEAELGVGVAVWGPLSVRVLGDYSSTRYQLDPDPSGTWAATSAEDRYLGMRAVVRGEF
jgi:hypothetical protein